MDRSAQLFSAVDKFNSAHEQWADDANSKHPTLAYWRAFDEMLEAFQGGDMPANCRHLATAVYKLAQEKAAFDISGIEHPANSFWAARELLYEAAKSIKSPNERKHLETIQELDRQKVPHEQIARIWGLTRSDGTGLAYLVQEELNNPGSVIGADYVHPNDKKQEQEMHSAKSKYLELAAQTVQEEVIKAQDDEKPCPETPRELWLINVSTQQAARMLKLDQSEVSRMWAEFEAEKQASIAAREGRTQPPAPPIQVEQPAIIAPVVAEAATEPTGDTPSISSSASSIDPLDDPYDDDEEDEDEIDSEDDIYSEFRDWTDDDVKEEAKRLKISFKGRYVRQKWLDGILAADPIPMNSEV